MTGDISSHRAMTRREWGLLLALSSLWGGAFFFVGVAVRELPPLMIVTLRVALAALFLHGLLRFKRIPFPGDGRAWGAFFGMGLLNNAVPFTLLAWGQVYIGSGVAAILNATTPLFTVIVAHFLTQDERMTKGRIGGVVLGLAGVAVMIGGAAASTFGRHGIAELGVLAAAVSYALAGVFGRRFKAMGLAPLTTAAGQVTASSLILLPATLIVARPWQLPLPSAEAMVALIGLALLSTALAYVLYFRLLAAAGATNVLLVTLLIPVSAILLGVFGLGESLQARHLGGMALIGAGLLVIDGRPWRALLRRRGCRAGQPREERP